MQGKGKSSASARKKGRAGEIRLLFPNNFESLLDKIRKKAEDNRRTQSDEVLLFLEKNYK